MSTRFFAASAALPPMMFPAMTGCSPPSFAPIVTLLPFAAPPSMPVVRSVVTFISAAYADGGWTAVPNPADRASVTKKESRFPAFFFMNMKQSLLVPSRSDSQLLLSPYHPTYPDGQMPHAETFVSVCGTASLYDTIFPSVCLSCFYFSRGEGGRFLRRFVPIRGKGRFFLFSVLAFGAIMRGGFE